MLLAAGEPGMRTTLPNARVLIHQPHGGAQGQSTDIEIQVREMVEMRERMVDVLVRATGQDRERIIADIDRDKILRGEDAVAYGLVDAVLEERALRPLPERGRRRPVAAPPGAQLALAATCLRSTSFRPPQIPWGSRMRMA